MEKDTEGSNMKGIILAGGSGTRLYPLTAATAKSLLPVYDKPMLYYPLCILMEAGITEILVISSPAFMPDVKRLLGDGSRFGIRLSYAEQEAPRGIAEAFSIGADFIGEDGVCLALGDNLFYGDGFSDVFIRALTANEGATVFLRSVESPKEFGICELDSEGGVLSLEEKPRLPRSSHAVTGLYIYDNSAVKRAEQLMPSERGELEITDLNKLYLQSGELRAVLLGEDTAWFDMGTPDALLEAGNFICEVQKKTGRLVCSPEETAWRGGLISEEALRGFAKRLKHTEYGNYILRLTGEKT